MKIKTEYDPPPVPLPGCAWSAIDEDTYDGPGSPVGMGASEDEAIQDLMEQLESA